MGVDSFWQEDFLLTIGPNALYVATIPYCIVHCQAGLFVHLVPLKNNFTSLELLNLQAEYAQENKLLVQLWEDVWMAKRDQVLARINSFLGKNKSLHARKTQVEVLAAKQMRVFLTAFHLQGYVNAKYHYGLVIDNQLVAAASFSETRPMKSKGDAYQSAELVRFASRSGITVVGGLSKLIKHYVKQIAPNDIMTYADRDWSLGKGYDKLKFQLSEVTSPAFLYIHLATLTRYFPHRLPKEIKLAYESQNALHLDDFLLSKGFVKIFNTGNLKYHLYL